jgi:hypothetical protein
MRRVGVRVGVAVGSGVWWRALPSLMPQRTTHVPSFVSSRQKNQLRANKNTEQVLIHLLRLADSDTWQGGSRVHTTPHMIEERID